MTGLLVPKVIKMVCLNPITAWKIKCSSLTEHPIEYYRNKKIRFKNPHNEQKYEQIKIPCGRCKGCLLDRSNMWATRIILETENHKENCFITLTYNPENVPKTESGHLTLCKKDFQDFIKRLREHLNGIKISYFLCGEYGTLGRPHGHLCLFGWIPKDLTRIMNSKTENAMYTSEELAKVWGNGYIVVQELTYKSAAYTARYCMKKAGLKPQKRISTGEVVPDVKQDERTGKYFIVGRSKRKVQNKDKWGRENEFILMSKKPAIGLNYWNKHKERIKENEGILLKIENNVQKKPIPRYFKKIWEKEDMSEFDTAQYRIKKQAEYNHMKILENINSANKEKTWLETIKHNLLKRANLLKRNQN